MTLVHPSIHKRYNCCICGDNLAVVAAAHVLLLLLLLLLLLPPSPG